MLANNFYPAIFDAVFTKLQTIEPGAVKTYAMTFDPKNLRGRKVVLTPNAETPLAMEFSTRGADKAECGFVVSVFDRATPGEDLGAKVAQAVAIAQAFERLQIGSGVCIRADVPVIADGTMLNESNIFFASIILTFAIYG